jgi:hypothetical protein
MDREELVRLAETLRSELAADAVPELDALVVRLRSGEPVDDEVYEVLTSTKPLRQRMNELVPANEDEDKGVAGRAFQELPGHGEPVAAITYACPEGDYSYPALEVGEPIPLCPTHNVRLEPC